MLHFPSGTTLKYLSIILLVIGLNGCGIHFTKSSDVDDREEKNSILVFGFLDDSEAPFTMEWGEIKQVRPAIDEPYQELRSNSKGLFYLENLPVGSYQLAELGGPDKGFLSSDEWTWGFSTLNNKPGFERTQLRAGKPGVYFLGAYKIDLVKEGGMFSFDKYETIPVKKPTEKEALKQLLSHTKGTRWERIVRNRIKQLK